MSVSVKKIEHLNLVYMSVVYMSVSVDKKRTSKPGLNVLLIEAID